MAKPIETKLESFHGNGDYRFRQRRMNAEQDDAVHSTWIGLLERDLAEIFVQRKNYPVITLGKLKNVFVPENEFESKQHHGQRVEVHPQRAWENSRPEGGAKYLGG